MDMQFEEALNDLVAKHKKQGTDQDTIISSLEMVLMSERENSDE